MTKASLAIASILIAASGCGSVEVTPNPGSSSNGSGAGGGGSSSTTSTSATTSSAGGGGAGGAGCEDPAWTMAPFRPTFEPRRFPVFVWTGLACIWSGSRDLHDGGEDPVNGGSCYDRESGLWTDLPQENDPWSRSCASAAWSGSEIVVWGGSKSIYGPFWGDQDGGRYSPSTEAWTPTSTKDAPSARRTQGGVWDGSGLLVWGGMAVPADVSIVYLADGGRYDPATDTWYPMDTLGAPAPRAWPFAAWTGSKMLVWGGQGEGGVAFNDGALYDPATNSWSPMSTEGAPSPRLHVGAAFANGKLLVFGGCSPDAMQTPLGDGYQYDLATDTWSALPPSPLEPRRDAAVTWTRKRFVVWGGDKGSTVGSFWSDGAFYDPQTSTWTPTPACGPRGGLTSAITGPDGAVLYNGDRSELWFLDDP